MQNILTPELMQDIITIAVIPILSILANYIIMCIKKKIEELEHRIDSAVADKYLAIAEDTVCTAVTAVSQTIVDTQKKSGSFNQAAAEEAFAIAKQQALSIMGQSAKDILKEAYGDIDAWIAAKIEYYVSAGKR